jgi:ORF6N domain
METKLIELLRQNPVVVHGQRGITLAQMDELHGRPKGTATRAWQSHKNKLIESQDYCRLKVTDAKTFNVFTSPRQSEDVIVLHLSGYLMLVKTFRDKLAWEVQRELVNTYFMVQEVRKAAAGLDRATLRELMEELVADVREQLMPELQSMIEESRPERQRHFTLADRMGAVGWLTAGERHKRQVRNLIQRLLRLEGHGLPMKDKEGPGGEWIFTEGQVRLVDDAIYRIWNEVLAAESNPLLDYAEV